MKLEVKDVATPADLMSETLASLCSEREPYLMMSATLYLESGDNEVLVERDETAWWPVMEGQDIVDMENRYFRVCKIEIEGGKLRLASAGQVMAHLHEAEEEPVCWQGGFMETLSDWVGIVSIGLAVSLVRQYPWPGRKRDIEELK